MEFRVNEPFYDAGVFRYSITCIFVGFWILRVDDFWFQTSFFENYLDQHGAYYYSTKLKLTI